MNTGTLVTGERENGVSVTIFDEHGVSPDDTVIYVRRFSRLPHWTRHVPLLRRKTTVGEQIWERVKNLPVLMPFHSYEAAAGNMVDVYRDDSGAFILSSHKHGDWYADYRPDANEQEGGAP